MAEGYEIVHDDLKANCFKINWGSSFTIETCKYAVIFVDYSMFIQYWPASDTNVNIAIYKPNSTGFTKAGTNTVTFGLSDPDGTDYTITRNTDRMVFTSSSNHTMFVVYANSQV